MGYPNVKAKVTMEGKSVRVRVDLLPSADAYAVNDVIGTIGGSGALAKDGGKIPLANALRTTAVYGAAPPGTGLLHSLVLIDGGNQKPALTILIYGAKPTCDCFDNQQYQGDLDDTYYIIGKITVAATDWVTITGSAQVFAIAQPQFQAFQVGVIDTNLYAVFISGGTPDWTGATPKELVALFGFLQD